MKRITLKFKRGGSGYRRFIQGPVTDHGNGVLTVEPIDVTSLEDISPTVVNVSLTVSNSAYNKITRLKEAGFSVII